MSMSAEEALYKAAEGGDTEQVRQILQSTPDVDINWKNIREDGNTSLYIAAAWGDRETVQLLLEKGASVNLRNNQKRSPLYIAASWGHWDVIKLLLQRGAEITDRDITVAAYTVPRRAKEEGDRGTFFFGHARMSKPHAQRLAKTFIENTLNNNQFLDLLVNLEEDGALLRTEIPPEEAFPDNIMNVVMYYNHFATVQLLLRTRVENLFKEELQKYNQQLLEHRFLRCDMMDNRFSGEELFFYSYEK